MIFPDQRRREQGERPSELVKNLLTLWTERRPVKSKGDPQRHPDYSFTNKRNLKVVEVALTRGTEACPEPFLRY